MGAGGAAHGPRKDYGSLHRKTLVGTPFLFFSFWQKWTEGSATGNRSCRLTTEACSTPPSRPSASFFLSRENGTGGVFHPHYGTAYISYDKREFEVFSADPRYRCLSTGGDAEALRQKIVKKHAAARWSLSPYCLAVLSRPKCWLCAYGW